MPMPMQMPPPGGPQGMMGPPPGMMPGGPPMSLPNAGPRPMPQRASPQPAPPGGAMPPAQGAPPGEDEELDFEMAMEHLTMAGLSQLDDVDFKALTKLTPELSWVLSKIYGRPAIETLRKAGASQRKGFAGGPQLSASPAQAGTQQPMV